MKILCLGDSITEGTGSSSLETCYVSLLQKKTGFEVLNYGVGGTRIARQKKRTEPVRFDWDFLQRAEIMEKDADFVFVFGGTNDYGHGDADFGEKDSRDPYTFCGAVNLLADFLSATYGRENLCFILPLRRLFENEKGKLLETYVNALRGILAEKGITYLDFYRESPEKPEVSGSEYFADGLHPNDKGHEWIADRLYNYLKQIGRA